MKGHSRNSDSNPHHNEHSIIEFFKVLNNEHSTSSQNTISFREAPPLDHVDKEQSHARESLA